MVGGGRWARVIVDVLCGLVPPTVGIAIHSAGGAGAMRAWAAERGWSDRLSISALWPAALEPGTAVIVVNRARDHERAAAAALEQGCTTLVEKPLAVTAEGAAKLAELVRERPQRLSVSQVFLFARYLENFAARVSQAGPITELEIVWTDPATEERYGEAKRYDPGLPVFADCLPHVIPVIERLAPGVFSDDGVEARFSRGGARCDLHACGDDGRAYRVTLERNAIARRRVVRAIAGGEIWELDASREPGVITGGGSSESGDSKWETGPRPLARLLTAFLAAAAGAPRDARLDIAVAQLSCRVVDAVRIQARTFAAAWLASALPAGRTAAASEADVRYALAEALQEDSPIAPGMLDELIARVRREFDGDAGRERAESLASVADPAAVLRMAAGIHDGPGRRGGA